MSDDLGMGEYPRLLAFGMLFGIPLLALVGILVWVMVYKFWRRS